MKIYIFMTANIHKLGGAQRYVQLKTEYLKKMGWSVLVFSTCEKSGKCAIPALDEFLKYGRRTLRLPPFLWPSIFRNIILKGLIKDVRSMGNAEKIIIESHADTTSQWGELLAEQIGAKHICFITREYFRGVGSFYSSKIEFYMFKHKRRELAGISKSSLSMLFDGYMEVADEECYTLKACGSNEAVKDIVSPEVESIPKRDFNIGYIGRGDKGYVPNIILGVAEFAQNHEDKEINFITVGDINSKNDLITQYLDKKKNLNVICMGNMLPIPRCLYEKLDVVIAGAGCANCSAYEKTYTIVADAQNFKANGLFGYDTFNIFYSENYEKQMSFCEALERVLIERYYEGMQCLLPERVDVEVVYKKHFNFIDNSDSVLEYYDRKELCSYNKNLNILFELCAR